MIGKALTKQPRFEVRLELRLEPGEDPAAWSDRCKLRTEDAHAKGFFQGGDRRYPSCRCRRFGARWPCKDYQEAARRQADLAAVHLGRQSAIVAILRYSPILDPWAARLLEESQRRRQWGPVAEVVKGARPRKRRK